MTHSKVVAHPIAAQYWHRKSFRHLVPSDRHRIRNPDATRLILLGDDVAETLCDDVLRRLWCNR